VVCSRSCWLHSWVMRTMAASIRVKHAFKGMLHSHLHSFWTVVAGPAT
jgi:hypothetical protein